MTTKLASMADIIGWKHNHQSGMRCVDGEITEFPGGIPSDSDIATWKSEYTVWKSAMDEIHRLESLITPRRAREHMLGTGGSFIADIEAKIETERSKL